MSDNNLDESRQKFKPCTKIKPKDTVVIDKLTSKYYRTLGIVVSVKEDFIYGDEYTVSVLYIDDNGDKNDVKEVFYYEDLKTIDDLIDSAYKLYDDYNDTYKFPKKNDLVKIIRPTSRFCGEIGVISNIITQGNEDYFITVPNKEIDKFVTLAFTREDVELVAKYIGDGNASPGSKIFRHDERILPKRYEVTFDIAAVSYTDKDFDNDAELEIDISGSSLDTFKEHITRVPLSVLEDAVKFTHADDLEVDKYGSYAIDIDVYISNLKYCLEKYYKDKENKNG